MDVDEDEEARAPRVVLADLENGQNPYIIMD